MLASYREISLLGNSYVRPFNLLVKLGLVGFALARTATAQTSQAPAVPDSLAAPAAVVEIAPTGLMTPQGRYWSLAAHGSDRAVFAPPTEKGGLLNATPIVGVSGILHNLIVRRIGLEIDGHYAWGSGQVTSSRIDQLSYDMNAFEVGVALLYEYTSGAPLVPFVGVRAAFATLRRTFNTTTYLAPQQSLTTFPVGAFVGLKYCFTPKIAIAARARVHYLAIGADGVAGVWTADFGGYFEYAFGASP